MAILCHSREQVLQNMRNVTYHFPAVPGRHPCSHRPCRHSRGWVRNQEPHPRARPEDQEDSSGATGGDGWVQRSEGASGYPRQSPLTPMTIPPRSGNKIGSGGSNLRDGLDPCDMQTGTSSGRIWRSSTSGRNDAGSDGVCGGVCVGRERRCVGSRSWQLGSFSVVHHFPAPSSSYPESNVRHLTVTNSISECLRCLL